MSLRIGGKALRRSVAPLAAVALVLTGCGSDDGGASGDSGTAGEAEPASLVVATPFPSALAFPELFVATANGYFEDEALEIQVEPLDGSGSTLQALATGQVQVAVPSPAPIFQAAAGGDLDPVSIYTSYQQGIFSLITVADTGVQSVEDLKGKTVGVGALDGGEVPIVKGLLSEAGLQEGKDYTLLAVGDGGTAAAAMAQGDIAAYGAAFVDVLILEGNGVDTIDLAPDGFKGSSDTHYVVTQDMVDGDPDVVVRFGRALARAAEWQHANPNEALDLICTEFEEECSDRAFAEELLDAVLELEALPPGAEGQWGWTDLDRVQQYSDLLVEEGELEETVDASELFTNEFVEQFNES